MSRCPSKQKFKSRAATASGYVVRGGWLAWIGVFLAVLAQVFHVVMGRLANDELADGAWLMPLVVWSLFAVLACWWSRPTVFAGDRGFVFLTVLLLGLGVGEQLRLRTWAESWTDWRAYAPLIVGCLGFLFMLRVLTTVRVEMLLRRLAWGFWIAALGTLGILFFFGRSYRGGLFLPGQINPSELVKLGLVAFGAVWISERVKPLSRTVMGVPCPPFGVCIAFVLVWGLPLFGGLIVRDLGLVLILCLTVMLMLTAATRRFGWFLFGIIAAGIAGWAIQFISTHTRQRFSVWLDPFQDPTGSGWQIGQSLCAQFAGGLWGTGIGEGTPGAVPIVTNDFVYAAVAEEWGLVGCVVLLSVCWLWIAKLSRMGDVLDSSICHLFGTGVAALMGVQIVLNVGGVTKALPMTGITFPFLSQGGFSLLTVLLACGLAAALGNPGVSSRRA